MKTTWRRVLSRLPQGMVVSPWLLMASICSMVVALLIAALGLAKPLDQSLSDTWFSLSKAGPSGEIVLVDLTRAAAEQGDGVRLPRAQLAELLDDVAAAGAERILIDLTLAGETTPTDDAALEASLARLGPKRVALTAAAVAATDGSGVTHWQRSPTLGRFASHAARVASDLAFDADGRLRRFGVDAVGLAPMQSSADWLAGRVCDTNVRRRLDFGIDVRLTPTIDAVEVLAQRVARHSFERRNVVLANFASAIGQEIRVPRFGTLRRPEITLLSAETILRGRYLSELGLVATLVSLIVLASSATLWTARLGAALGLVPVICGSVILLGVAVWCQEEIGRTIPIAEYILALLVSYACAQIATHPSLNHMRDMLVGMAGRVDLRLARVLDATGEALMTFGPDGKILSMNAAAQHLFARSRSTQGGSISDLIGAQADDLMAATTSSRPGHVEATIEQGSAGRRYLDLRVNSMRADAGEWVGIATIRDVTEHRAQVDALRRMAIEDPLTGLPNRLGFERALAQGCEPSADGKAEMAVMMCDLDGFKGVNDTLGHQAGDVLLREIGRRLLASAPPDTMVARLGGDEFGLVLRGPRMDAVAAEVAERLVSAVAVPIAIEGRTVTVGVSIGVALYPVSGSTPDDLVRVADAAMFRSKRTRSSSQRGHAVDGATARG